MPFHDGRDVWLARLGIGALVGEMGVLDGGPRSADVSAVPRTELLDLGARLARLLLESQGATVALSQGEMARLIGASRERVNRKLGVWRTEGCIEVGPYGVKVLNRAALAASASPTPSV